MKPFLADPDVVLYQGDALDVLRQMPDESVHMCCTSPPFYGLRDYGTGRWEGGDPDCDHLAPLGGGTKASGLAKYENRDTCRRCGARRVDQQIGLEPTPDEWVARLVEVFREVRRVLRSDGTFWLEIGDSYASKARGSDAGWDKSRLTNPGGTQKAQAASLRDMGERHRGKRAGIKEKEIMGMPWTLAFALSDDGWYVRSEIIWAKPNPMPESVTDRPTTSHSRVFLLTKSGQPTYWLHREGRGARVKPKPDWRWVDQVTGAELDSEPDGDWRKALAAGGGRRWRRMNLWRSKDYFYDADAIREPHSPDGRAMTHVQKGDGSVQPRDGERWPGSGRNRRSVWEIATEPYPEAHFATWPQKLVTPMILAGTSERGVCTDCGAPWERVVERTGHENGREPAHVPGNAPSKTDSTGWAPLTRATDGWQPSCDHYLTAEDAEAVVPATVLDVFSGAGTTALVARRLGRLAVGVELNPEYCALATDRLAQQSLFAEPDPDPQITVDEAPEAA